MLHKLFESRFNVRTLWVRILALVIIFVIVTSQARADETAVLSAAVIRGSDAFSPAELFPTYSGQLGRPIGRDSAKAIVAAIEQLYVDDGYTKPQTRVDDALASRGVLRIDVYEAHITGVTISGDPGPHAARLHSLGDALQQAKPVRRDDLQETLRLMRALPGLSVAATTRRDELEPNGYVLALEAEFEPLEGLVRVTNRGTEEIGPTFVLGQLIANGLLGRQEKLGLLFAGAADYAEYHGTGLFIDVPVGSAGTHATLTAFGSWSDPSERPVELSEQYRRERATLRLTRPLRREPGWSLALAAAFELEDLEIDADGVSLREDRLRVLELGGRLSWRSGPSTTYMAELELRQGIGGFGSGLQAPTLSDDPRRADFLLTRLQLIRHTRLSERWSLRIDAVAQHSAYVLPYGERFKIGGERLGRGFEKAEIAGDRGAGAKAELRREMSGADGPLGKTALYVFYDLGAAWKQDLGGRESAATAGLGLALTGRRAGGYVELAQPLTHADVEGDTDLAVFAELSLRF